MKVCYFHSLSVGWLVAEHANQPHFKTNSKFKVMGSFIIGALTGLVIGVIFSAPIWNWIKSGANKVKDTVEKNQTPKA